MSEQHPSSPTNAEDRKAAAALSSLDAQHQSSDEDDHAHGSKPSKQAATIDQEALERAISRLEMSSKSKGLPERGGKDEGGRGKGKATVGDGGDVAEEEAKKKIRVDAGDVALLVEELELSKAKATDLLRAHEGDAVRAMRAFVTAPV